MAVESTNTIEGLVSTNPLIQDPVHNGPDHLWLIKNVLKKTFPGKNLNGFSKPITATEDEINALSGLTTGQGIQSSLDSKVNLSGGKLTGILEVLEPTSGTHATSKAYVDALVSSSVKSAEFPKGTAMLFAQGSAPPGWTRVSSDAANNRMLRVVSSGGGGLGGTDDPTINNKVAAHSHSFNTAAAGAHTHTLSANTSWNEVNHSHSYSGVSNQESQPHKHYFTGYTDTKGSHGHSGILRPGVEGYKIQFGTSADIGYAITDAEGNHFHWLSGSTEFPDVTHTHEYGGWTSADKIAHGHTLSGTTSEMANHSHSGQTDVNASASSWQPRFIDIIIATKD